MTTGRLLVNGGLTMAATSLAFFLLALLAAEGLESLGSHIIDLLGPPGVVLAVIASDALAIPLPPSAFVLIAIAAGERVALTLFVACAATVVGASLAYLLGPYVARLPLIHRWVEPRRARATQLFSRHGLWAVVFAALTPVPFSLICWLAGTYQMCYRRFFVASLVRIPRLLLYATLFHIGWHAAL